jgi:hypothetical protein
MIMMKKIVCEIEVFLLCAGSECEGFRESGVKKNSREIFFLFIFQFLGIAFHWSLFKFSMEQRKLVVSYIYINYIFLLIELIKNSRYWTSCFYCLILKNTDLIYFVHEIWTLGFGYSMGRWYWWLERIYEQIWWARRLYCYEG